MLLLTKLDLGKNKVSRIEGLESLLPAFRAFGVLYEKAAAIALKGGSASAGVYLSKAAQLE